MTRISTAHAFDSTLDRLVQRQGELSDAQQQLSSGKRVNRASDDPTAAARAERALASIARADATQRAVQTSQTQMTQTEGALGDAGELLQQAREALVAAGNASYSDAERKGLAQKLSGIRAQLLSIANRGDGANGYLFGGQGSNQPPFLDAAGGVQFRGIGGQAQVAGDEALPVTLDGKATWLSAPTGNGVFETRAITSTGSAWIDGGGVSDPSAVTGSTYSVQFSVSGGATTYSVLKDGAATAQTNVTFASGKAIEVDGMSFTISGNPAAGDEFELRPSTPTLSVFDAFDKAIADLSATSRSSGQIAQANAENLRNIDSVRSDVGETLNRIDGVTNRLAGQKLQGETDRSNAEDLDMVQAISDFQNKQSGYDAALKSYSMVQRLSLFQYINS